MFTLCIRYTIDPNRLKHFRDYVEHELEAIRNAGGKIVGCWLPTDYAGPTNIARADRFFDARVLRTVSQSAGRRSPPQRNADELTCSGAIITMERSIIERCSDGKQDQASSNPACCSFAKRKDARIMRVDLNRSDHRQGRRMGRPTVLSGHARLSKSAPVGETRCSPTHGTSHVRWSYPPTRGLR
jgi:hypothetical protein